MLFMRIAARILGPNHPFKVHPSREIGTRWGSNQLACGNINEGLQIVNESGQSFWELLFLELKAEKGDWRQGSCDLIIEHLNMEEIHFGLWLEYEMGRFFNDVMLWLGQCGEIWDAPGYRLMDIPMLLLRQVWPYWDSLERDPNDPTAIPAGYYKHWPRTMALIKEWETKADKLKDDNNDPAIAELLKELDEADNDDDIAVSMEAIGSVQQENEVERQRLLELVKTKFDQLSVGVSKSLGESAKLTADFIRKPRILTLFLLDPIHGAKILRAILVRVREGGLDLDGHWEHETTMSISSNNPSWIGVYQRQVVCMNLLALRKRSTTC